MPPEVRVRLSAEGQKEVIDTFRKLQTEADRTGKRGSKSFGGLNTALKSMKGLLAGVGAAFGVFTAIRFASRGIDKLRKWGSAWAEVRTIMNATDTEAASVEKRVRGLASIIPKEQSLLAKGYYQALSSGITDTGDALFFVKRAGKAATAGLTDVNTAVDAGTTILNAYDLEIDQTDRIFDVLFSTVREGKVTFPELAQSIGTAIPTFAQAQIPIEDLAASLATLTKGGLKIDLATTAMRSALLAVIKPSEEAKQLADELGLSFDVQSVAAKGLVPWLQEVAEKTGGNTEVIAKLFPNVRGLNAILALSGNQWKEYARILDVVENQSAGATQEAFDRINETMEAQEQLMRNRLKNAWIEFGAAVMEGGKQALADFGALLPETFEMQTERLGRLQRQINRVNDRGRALAKTYDALVRESDGSEEAQRRIEAAMHDLAEVFPEVVTEIDEYGNVIAINTDLLANYQSRLESVYDLETRRTFLKQAEDADRLEQELRDAADAYNALGTARQRISRRPGVTSGLFGEGLGVPVPLEQARRNRLAMIDALRVEQEATNRRMAQVLVQTGLSEQILAFEEYAKAVEEGVGPTSELEDAIRGLSPQLRNILDLTDPEEMAARIREWAKLLQEMGKAPEEVEEPEGDDPAEAGRGQLALVRALRDREVQIFKAQAQARNEEEQRAFDKGLIGVREYFERRRQILTEQLDAEIATLEKKRATTAAGTEGEKRTKDLAKIDSDLQEARIDRERQLAALTFDEIEAIEELGRKRARFEQETMKLQGKRHQAAMVDIEQEISEYRLLLQQQGVEADKRQRLVKRYADARKAVAAFEDVYRDAEGAMANLDLERARIEADVAKGLITQLEGEQRIIQVEEQRLPLLREIADALILAAERTKDPELIRQAKELAAAIAALGGRLQSAGLSLQEFKEQAWDAAENDLAAWLSDGITEADNLGSAMKKLAASVVQSLRRIASEIIATEAIGALRGLFAGGGLVETRATGGLILGPGSGTSDSIPAMLSNHEFVEPAHIVRKPGMLQHLEALRRGMEPVELVDPLKYRMPQFHAGGLVDPAPGSAMAAPRDGSLIVGLERGLVLQELSSPEGQKLLVQLIGRNRRAIGRAMG